MTSMTVTTGWLGASGLWSDADLWSSGVPSSSSIAVIVTAQSQGTITVGLDTRFTVGLLALAMGSALLDINGGLTLTGTGSALAGSIDGMGDLYVGGGGVATLDAGLVLNVATFGVKDANYGDSGTVDLGGNIADGNTFLVNAHDFDIGGGGLLQLDGYTLALSGFAGLYGLINGPGEIIASGIGEIGSSTNGTANQIGGGTTIDITGSLNQVGNTELGTTASDSATLIIARGATLNVYDDANIFTQSTVTSGAIIDNAGLLQRSGDTGQSVIQPTLVNTGTIDINQGAMSIASLLVNDGVINIGTLDSLVISGATFEAGAVTADPGATGLFVIGQLDTFAISGPIGSNETISFAPNGHYSYLGGGGVLQISDVSQFDAPISGFEPGDTIEILNDQLTGAKYTSSHGTTPSELSLFTGSNSLTGGPPIAVLTLSGLTAQLGPQGTFINGNFYIVPEPSPNASDTLVNDYWTVGSGNIATDANWSTGVAPNTAAVANFAGPLSADTVTINTAIDIATIQAAPVTFDQTGGILQLNAGGYIDGAFDQAGGTLDIGGILALNGGGTIASTVQGLGQILFNGGDFILANAALIGSQIGLSGSGTLTPIGTERFNGHGDLLGGTIAGTGTLDAYGASDIANVIIASGATLLDGQSGTMSAVGNVVLGSNIAGSVANLSIDSAATFTFLGDFSINANGTAAVTNSGDIIKTGDSGNAAIIAPFVNDPSGTIDIAAGGLSLLANDTLGGQITGPGTLLLLGATFTLAPTVALNVGTIILDGINGFDPTAELKLTADTTYNGVFVGNGSFFYPVTLDLNSYNISLGGLANQLGNMVITDPGTVTITGGAGISGLSVVNNVTLLDSGSIIESGNLNLGNSSTDTSELSISSGAVYTMIAGNTIAAVGSIAIINEGIFEQNGSLAQTVIDPGFTNTGAGILSVQLGTLILSSTLVNDGVVDVIDGATLSANQGVTASPGDTGTIAIGADGVANLGGIVSANELINFTGAGGLLQIETVSAFAAIIDHFSAGDSIDLNGFTETSQSYDSATNLLTLSGNDGSITLDIPNLIISNVTVTVGSLGTVLSQSLACFAQGTRILTTRGEIPVENLTLNDHVILHTGATAPIQWLGHRFLSLLRHPHPEQVNPIRIQAGAIADNIPHRDLILSPDHALYLNGALIPAKTLINRSTIYQESPARITYYHVELPTHAVLLAEGTETESYLETGNRDAFANGSQPVRLHPAFGPSKDWQAVREAVSCAPLAEDGPVVEAARARILERAAIDISTNPGLAVTRRPDGSINIASRAAIPGHLSPDPRDRRTLGVKIAAIHRANGTVISLDHPDLTTGWHDPEPDGRWTSGNALIPAHLAGDGLLRLTIAATMTYPIAGEAGRQRQHG